MIIENDKVYTFKIANGDEIIGKVVGQTEPGIVLHQPLTMMHYPTYNNKGTSMTKAVVWSKDSCPFCVQAKALLKQRGIEVEERNISQDWTREQLLEAVPTARTLPQIFLDDELVGGFTELKKRLS